MFCFIYCSVYFIAAVRTCAIKLHLHIFAIPCKIVVAFILFYCTRNNDLTQAVKPNVHCKVRLCHKMLSVCLPIVCLQRECTVSLWQNHWMT